MDCASRWRRPLRLFRRLSRSNELTRAGCAAATTRHVNRQSGSYARLALLASA